MKTITIDPITRLEGHGKINIFLNDKGNVENAYLQIPELRGFERFSQGRRAEDMPQITSRICGVCPVAHHFAAIGHCHRHPLAEHRYHPRLLLSSPETIDARLQ